MSTELLSLTSEQFTIDPHAVYARLRARYGKLAPVDLLGYQAHLILDYRLALDVLRAPGRFPRDPREWEKTLPYGHPLKALMGFRPNAMFADGAEHRRLRRATVAGLARIKTYELRAYTESAARRVLAALQPAGHADLLGDYILTVLLDVFGRFLFGSPDELVVEHERGMRGMFDQTDPNAGALLVSSMTALVGLKRHQPGNDLPSWMIDLPEALADQELVHALILLMGAGTEPLCNLVGNALRMLLTDEQFADLVLGGTEVVESALDLVEWTDPPIANYAASFPKQDIELCGRLLPAHQPVLISFAAANNDPELGAGNRAGNEAHFAYSAGLHECPARRFARTLATILIEVVLDELPDIELGIPVNDLRWRSGGFNRALAALPVSFTPAQPLPQPAAAGSPARPPAPTLQPLPAAPWQR